MNSKSPVIACAMRTAFGKYRAGLSQIPADGLLGSATVAIDLVKGR